MSFRNFAQRSFSYTKSVQLSRPNRLQEMDLTRAKALSFVIRTAPFATCLYVGAPAALLPKIMTYGACLKWFEKADHWMYQFGLGEKIYGMRKLGGIDRMFATLDPQTNVIRCAKLGKLDDGKDINDLKAHFRE